MHVTGLSCEIAGRTLLADVDLALERGQVLAMLGPSGSGKSLLLRCLLGLAPPTARVRGALRWEERRFDLADRRGLAQLRGRGLALVPQEAAASLDPVRPIGAQLAEVRDVHRGADGPAELLAQVGLSTAFAERFPHELSGGQAQRVAIALALACRPTLLLADEATAALDFVAQQELLDLMISRCHARQIGLVLVSHDLALLARGCARAVVLAAGRLVEDAPMERLVDAPEHPVTRTLVAAARRSTLGSPDR